MWRDVGTFQAAFAIGKNEADAAWAMLTHMDPNLVNRLMVLVQPLGDNACGTSNTFCSVTSAIEALGRRNTMT